MLRSLVFLQSWVLRPVTDTELRGRADYEERERLRMTGFMRSRTTEERR